MCFPPQVFHREIIFYLQKCARFILHVIVCVRVCVCVCVCGLCNHIALSDEYNRRLQ